MQHTEEVLNKYWFPSSTLETCNSVIHIMIGLPFHWLLNITS